jgi:hypothetical protein
VSIRVVRGSGQRRARLLSVGEHGIDLLFAVDKMADAELTTARRIERSVRVLCEVVPSVQRQDQIAVEETRGLAAANAAAECAGKRPPPEPAGLPRRPLAWAVQGSNLRPWD